MSSLEGLHPSLCAALRRPAQSLLLLAYDAASVLIAAILQSDSTDGEKIAASLRQIRHAGLSGPISFAAGGANAAPRFRLYQYQNKGQWRPAGVFPPGAGQNEKCL